MLKTPQNSDSEQKSVESGNEDDLGSLHHQTDQEIKQQQKWVENMIVKRLTKVQRKEVLSIVSKDRASIKAGTSGGQKI